MTTNNEVNFPVLLVLNILEDLQMLFFSWFVIANADGSYPFLKYIFNPWDYLITNYSLGMHIAALILLTVLAGAMAYCSNSFSKGRFKVLWPLHLLRILTVFTVTIFFIPSIEILVHPLKCEGDMVYGFPVLCSSGGHIGLIVSCVVAAIFIIPYGTIMNILYFDPNPSSKVGKASGQLDVLYAWTRILLVLITTFIEPKAASILNFFLIGFLTLAAFSRQPFYKATLNNLRVGMFFSAWVTSVFAIAYAFIKPRDTPEIIFTAITLSFSVGSAVGGFFANRFLVEKMLTKIYDKIRAEYKKLEPQKSEGRIFKSQMSLILEDAHRLVKTRAINEKTRVFLNVFWPEIAVRFIHTAYLDGQAVTMAYQVFETGFKQFPRSARLHLLFLEYNKDLMPVPLEEQAKHIVALKKRQDLPLPEKFHIYQLQQTHLQKTKSKGINEDDDENVNYMSFVEYQSLENSVRKYHVETLVELKDLWTAIKSRKPASELHILLDQVSNNATRTYNLYSTLLKRFPNSKNMANLHARFISRIYADKDALSSVVKLSSGASNDSGNSKQSMIQRQKRELLTERLNQPIRTFLNNSSIITFVYIGLVLASAVLSYMVFHGLDEMLISFSTNSSRSTAQNFMLFIRRMGIYSSIGDWTRFDATLRSLTSELGKWNTDVAPYFAGSLGSSLTLIVRIWDGTQYEAQSLSGLKVVTLVSSFVSTIVTQGRRFFTAPLSAYTRTEVRFLIDNVDNFVQLFTKARSADIEAAGAVLKGYAQIVYICLIVLIVMFVAFGLGFTYFFYDSFDKRQAKMLGLLEKIPKKAVNDLITDLEEEIEIVEVEDNAVSQKIKRKGKKKILAVPWAYLALLAAAIACTIGLLFDVQINIDATIGIPQINDLSTYRRAVIVQINRLAIDIMENDTTTYSAGVPLARVKESLLELQRDNEVLAEKFKMFMPPYESGDTKFFKAYRSGTCFFGNFTKEFCDSMTYDNSIGYTKTLATSGVDQHLAVFDETVQRYLSQRDFSLNSTSFKLLEQLTTLLVSSIRYKNNALTEFYEKKEKAIDGVIFAIAAIIVLLVGALHYIGFWKTCNQYIRNNRQLVGIFYGIQIEKSSMIEIHRFIESAGASL